MKTNLLKTLLLFVFAAIASNTVFAFSVSISKSSYNGYGVSCFGSTNGWLTANPTGGTSPYTYLWSNSATTQTISNLAFGTYTVTVTDAGSNTATASVTLITPSILNLTLTKSSYSNGYNVSCYQCFNGSITATTTPSGGASPYTYLWSDGATTQNRSSIGGGTYTVTMTDANGCTKVVSALTMTEPPNATWNMSGNAGSDPPTQFIGTTDNKDLVFKTNGVESMRIKADGKITTSQEISIDRLKVTRIVSPDSLIYIGDSTIITYPNVNRIFGGIGSAYKGLGLGVATAAFGYHSTALGCNVRTDVNSNNSVVIGYGTGMFANNIENSLMIGFNTWGSTPTLFVGPGDGTENSTGSVGIGTPYTTEKLVVKGDVRFLNDDDGTSNNSTRFNSFQILRGSSAIPMRRGITIDDDPYGNFNFWINGNQTGAAFNFIDGGVTPIPKTLMTITKAGQVGIGTTNFSCTDCWDYTLFVKGGIKTEKVKVELCAGSWCDYVFSKNYKLMSISELESFIRENKHLPDVLSGSDIEANGIDVAAMLKTQMQKIEELTLYVIQQQKEIDELKVQIKK